MSDSKVGAEKKLEIAYQYYEKTFSYIRQYSVLRDRLFLVVLALLVAFQVSTPKNAPRAIEGLLKAALGVTLKLTPGTVGTALWLCLLIALIRYFQTTRTVDIQYNILHEIEAKLCKLYDDKEDFFSRERIGYVRTSDYPWLRRLIWIFYSWIIPIVIVLVACREIFRERVDSQGPTLHLGLDFVFFFFIVALVGLYKWPDIKSIASDGWSKIASCCSTPKKQSSDNDTVEDDSSGS